MNKSFRALVVAAIVAIMALLALTFDGGSGGDITPPIPSYTPEPTTEDPPPTVTEPPYPSDPPPSRTAYPLGN